MAGLAEGLRRPIFLYFWQEELVFLGLLLCMLMMEFPTYSPLLGQSWEIKEKQQESHHHSTGLDILFWDAYL